MAYAFIIDRDHISKDEPEFNQTGKIRGTRGAREEGLVDKLKNGEGVKFRLYDDDGELYYEGRYVGPDDETIFGPQDWAMGYAGVTRTKLFEKGRWNVL